MNEENNAQYLRTFLDDGESRIVPGGELPEDDEGSCLDKIVVDGANPNCSPQTREAIGRIESEFPKPEGEFYDKQRKLSTEEILRARDLIAKRLELKEGESRRICLQDGCRAIVSLEGGVMEIVDTDGIKDNGYSTQRVNNRFKIAATGDTIYMEDTGDFDTWNLASSRMTNNFLYNTMYCTV